MVATNSLAQRSTRELQAYGAACLATFASAMGIRHAGIRELVEHLLRVLQADDLGRWDSQGSALSLCGRGDELPEEIASIPDVAQLFDCVVEIGLIDLYAGDTGGPLSFAEEVIDILQRNGVPVPSAEEIFGESRTSKPGWGPPLDTVIFERAHRWCLLRLDEARSNGVPAIHRLYP